MSIRIKLVGCNTYTYGPQGEKFEAGYEYELEDDKALRLLESTDDKGRHYFRRVEKPAPAMEDTVVEETTGEGTGGVRIIRKKGPKVANPKVKTSGDTSPLRDDGPDRAQAQDEEDEEGVEI